MSWRFSSCTHAPSQTIYVREHLLSKSIYSAAVTAIPILQKHIEFLVDRHSYFSALEDPPEELGGYFSTAWTREAISEVVSKGAGHLTKVTAFLVVVGLS